jgi:hypothetical protein
MPYWHQTIITDSKDSKAMLLPASGYFCLPDTTTGDPVALQYLNHVYKLK